MRAIQVIDHTKMDRSLRKGQLMRQMNSQMTVEEVPPKTGLLTWNYYMKGEHHWDFIL